MFSKPNKPSATESPPSAFSDDKLPNHDRKISGVPSIIGPDLKVIGDLKSSGNIQIDGTVEGEIKSRALTIGERGNVHGALVADTVRIYGSVAGEVKATTVTLAKTAKVEGDIAHQTLEIEAGASLLGQISHLDSKEGANKAEGPAMRPARAQIAETKRKVKEWQPSDREAEDNPATSVTHARS